MPLYVLGFMGMSRRMQHYDNLAWQPYLVVAFFGAVMILIGIFYQVKLLYVSIRDRDQNRCPAGDPWDGRTLEWATSAPPPFYNFAITPEIRARDVFTAYKAGNYPANPRGYCDIELPKSTPAGLFVGVFCGMLAFALVWHIWWAVVLAFVGVVAVVVFRSFMAETDYVLTAEEIEQFENQHLPLPPVI